MNIQQHEVVIVGGGAAGLVAAYLLRAHQPLILEASPEVGGRCRRAHHGALRDTIGAEGWYDLNPHTAERRLVEELGVDLSPAPGAGALAVDGRILTETRPEALFELLGLPTRCWNSFEQTWMRIQRAWKRLADPKETQAAITELLRCSAQEWLSPLESEVAGYFEEVFCAEFGARFAEIPALYLIIGISAFGGAGSGAWSSYLVPFGGGADITEALVARLSLPPRTGCRVESVESTAGGCKVSYRDPTGIQTVSAKRLILATPPRALESLFPSMPPWKRRALTFIRSYPIIEVSVRVQSGPRPWSAQSSIFVRNRAISMCLQSRTRTPGHEASTAADPSVVHLLAVGPTAERSWHLSDALLAQQFFTEFEAMFPQAAGRLETWQVHRWEEGLTLPTPGYQAYVPELLAPVGRVHFAGDYAGFVHASTPGGVGTRGDFGEMAVTVCLHTAVRSGIRAAREVLASFS